MGSGLGRGRGFGQGREGGQEWRWLFSGIIDKINALAFIPFNGNESVHPFIVSSFFPHPRPSIRLSVWLSQQESEPRVTRKRKREQN